jgi:hypothetical protein
MFDILSYRTWKTVPDLEAQEDSPVMTRGEGGVGLIPLCEKGGKYALQVPRDA